MEKLKLKKVKVADLVPAERNCRRHSHVQITELARSLKEFGQTRPFVIDEGNVVLVGNGMLAAMKSAGIDTAEAYVVSGWAESKKRKLILADNRCYELGSTDIDAIFDELKALGSAGDFDVPGFDAEAIQRLCDSVCDDAFNTMDARGVGTSYDAPVSKFSAGPVLEPQKQAQPESEAAPFVEEMPVASPAYVRSPGESSPSSIICPYCGKVFNSGVPK